MDANDWFANNAGLGRAEEHHNDFGGLPGRAHLEGKNFLLLFLRRCAAETTDDDRLRLFLPFRRGRARPPLLAPFLDAYPLPNGPISPDGYTAQYAGNYSNSGTLNATSLRIDHFFSSHFSIFGRYNYAPSQTVSLSSPGELDTIPVNTQTFTVGVNSEWGGSDSRTLFAATIPLRLQTFNRPCTPWVARRCPRPSLYLGNLSFPVERTEFPNV